MDSCLSTDWLRIRRERPQQNQRRRFERAVKKFSHVQKMEKQRVARLEIRPVGCLRVHQQRGTTLAELTICDDLSTDNKKRRC